MTESKKMQLNTFQCSDISKKKNQFRPKNVTTYFDIILILK